MSDGRNSAVDDTVRRAYERAKKSGVAITQYARSNRDEYFAESTAAYYLRPAELRAHDPNGYAMVEAVLRARGILK